MGSLQGRLCAEIRRVLCPLRSDGADPSALTKAVFYLLFDRLWWRPGRKQRFLTLWGLDMWRVLVVRGMLGTRRWP